MASLDIELDDLEFVPLVPYNGSGPTGGDSLTEDLNIWYEVCSEAGQLRLTRCALISGANARKFTRRLAMLLG